MSQADFDQAIHEIQHRRKGFCPTISLVLGSGLGNLADQIEEATVIPYKDIPGFPLSHVAGHAGNLVLGRLGKTQVAALAGRAHLYEGWTAEQSTFPLRCLAKIGTKSLIVSNASGGLNPRFRSGQVVLIDQYLDWMQRSPFGPNELTSHLTAIGHHRRNASPFDRDWMNQAEQLGMKLGFMLARGTYLATLGPTYETRAEYRMFSRMGADMVGMSTVPEILVANQLGMRVMAFSIVTNVATPDAPTKTEHGEVLDWSRKAQSQLIPLIKALCGE